jgi:hypothetical protein
VQRAKVTIIITSGEHYGAALNRDFDFHRYLDTLAKTNGRTRLWSVLTPKALAISTSPITLSPWPPVASSVRRGATWLVTLL